MSVVRTSVGLPALDSRSIRDIEGEILSELEFHIEMRSVENERAGMSPESAREAALTQFGNFAKIHKECRRALLGGRIMWQRLQTAVSLVLLVVVALLAIQMYSAQRANQAALADITSALKQLSDKPATGAVSMAAVPPTASTLHNWRKDRPVVVATSPETGATDVDPAVSEIRVTFSKPMADQSWSWVQVSKESFPESTGEVHYLDDGMTCVMPVKLQPGKKYVVWFNSANYQNFKDSGGRPAEPYLLTFSTRK
jgi:hypothetical protein